MDQVFITPLDPELDGDSDGDSGEEDGGRYVDNLKSLLQADSIAMLSKGKIIGGGRRKQWTQGTFPKGLATVQMDQESCFPWRPHRGMVGACTGS